MKRHELATIKLFVEFYLPQYQGLLDALKRSPYPLVPLRDISVRMFDGPFGSNRKVDMYRDSGIPYVRVKDVLLEGVNVGGLTYISEEKHQEIIRSRVVPGNVLITIAGRVGTAAVFPDAFPEGNITGHIAGVEAQEQINPHYLAAFINSWLGEFQIKRWSHRTTRPELNLRELEQVLISVPPRSIQDEIAEVVQNGYAVQAEKLRMARELRQSVDPQVLSDLEIAIGAHQDNKRFVVPADHFWGNRFDIGPWANEVNVEGISAVETVPLHELAELPYQTRIASKTPDVTFNYIGMADVDDSTGEVNCRQLLGSEINSNKVLLKGGDIVFARIEPCIYNRKTALIPYEIESALGSTELLVVRAKPGVSREFLLLILRSDFIQRQIVGRVTGTTGRRRLPNATLAELRIPSVSLDVQSRIGAKVNAIKESVKKLEGDASHTVNDAKKCVEEILLGMKNRPISPA